MAYQMSSPGQSQQDLENWFALALQQQAERKNAFAPQAQDMALTQAQLPQNYAMSSSGNVMDFGPSVPAWSGSPRGMQLDYASPIEIAGVGKGWLAKNDPTMTVYDNSGQPIASLGNDREAAMKLDVGKANLTHAQLQNQKLVKEINAKPRGMEPKLVDGQWILPPSAEHPNGVALPVEGFQRKTGDKAVAQDRVSELLGNLQANYETLRKSGATVDAKQNWMQNLRARAESSGLGQFVGGALGTADQEIRDKIQMAKPLLINEIRAATGMSAKAMDSNAELQFYLQAATDPTRNIEANLQAIKYLDSAYGKGKLSEKLGLPAQGQPTISGAIAPAQDLTPPEAGRSPKEQALIREALDAINRGADPVAVQKRLEQMGVQLRY